MNEYWVRLCDLIDDDPELGPAVSQAASGDSWMALIDGLDDAGALAYLERGDSGIELADALAQVPRVFRSGVDLDVVGDVDGDLDAAITVADGILSPHRLRILHLEEDDDAYPLVVVPDANVTEIVALATRLGHTVRVFS